MDYFVWLLISLSPIVPENFDIQRFKNAGLCQAELQAVHELDPTLMSTCVHSTQPWRRIGPAGPNYAEQIARAREASGLSAFDDPFKPKVKK